MEDFPKYVVTINIRSTSPRSDQITQNNQTFTNIYVVDFVLLKLVKLENTSFKFDRTKTIYFARKGKTRHRCVAAM